MTPLVMIIIGLLLNTLGLILITPRDNWQMTSALFVAVGTLIICVSMIYLKPEHLVIPEAIPTTVVET